MAVCLNILFLHLFTANSHMIERRETSTIVFSITTCTSQPNFQTTSIPCTVCVRDSSAIFPPLFPPPLFPPETRRGDSAGDLGDSRSSLGGRRAAGRVLCQPKALRSSLPTGEIEAIQEIIIQISFERTIMNINMYYFEGSITWFSRRLFFGQHEDGWRWKLFDLSMRESSGTLQPCAEHLLHRWRYFCCKYFLHILYCNPCNLEIGWEEERRNLSIPFVKKNCTTSTLAICTA